MLRTAPVILLMIVSALRAFAGEPSIEGLRAVTGGAAVTVSVSLEGMFDHDPSIEALQSGLPLVIVYQIDLIRKHENWFDSVLHSSEIELVATYNSLTREYLLNYRRNRKLVSSESIRSIDDLRKRMTSLVEPDLFEIGSHEPGQLRVRARAVLGRRYILHVIPRTIATDWEAVRVQFRGRP